MFGFFKNCFIQSLNTTSNGTPVGFCHAPGLGGGWRHLLSGHRNLPEEKCHPVTANRISDRLRRNRRLRPHGHLVPPFTRNRQIYNDIMSDMAIRIYPSNFHAQLKDSDRVHNYNIGKKHSIGVCVLDFLRNSGYTLLTDKFYNRKTNRSSSYYHHVQRSIINNIESVEDRDKKNLILNINII
ncbi:hypothetical protein AGLY_009399 [Aphis glycines]|uniref:Uncharacterized protein n=1 Tax=Aphis glycines TaxID=307491 RepID=A0A6G0THY1_APHGL|nr:hypothetical protein AGLY_009399 [Aphis glycines]